MAELDEIQQAISALEAQRAVLGDRVVDTALAPLREKLADIQPSSVASDQQLKLVTVLFTDVVGSTRIGTELDPEDTLAVMDTALRRFGGLIEAHGGRVLRFMGDGLKAVFGAPLSREDDAERAVRAGLALLTDCQAYSQEVETNWGLIGFNIRVGIHSGQVILGGGVEADRTAVGMPINLAARMESSAPPGSLRITSDTYRLVRGLFEVVEQEPLQVKGRDEPMRTYLVLGEKPRAFHPATRGLAGIQTRLIGREKELVQLKSAYESVLQAGKAHFITITGEPGVGKSRLLDEFTRWLVIAPNQTPLLFLGRAMPQMNNTPYALLNNLLAAQFDIRDSDSASQACLKLQEGLAPFLKDEPVLKAHFIGALAGYSIPDSPYLLGVKDDPIQLRDQGLFYLGQFFEALTAKIPAVIFLDDIHWADRPSLDAILRISQACAKHSLLVVSLARLRLFEENPNWGDPDTLRDAQVLRIDLLPLSLQSSQQLLHEILGGAGELPARLQETLVANAEGNPFYLEELVQVMIDDGVISYDPSFRRWQVDSNRGESLRIPATLTAVLQARLDSLPAFERKTLQQASVIGRSFWDALLREMQDTDRTPGDELDSLCQRGLVVPQPHSGFIDTNEFAFKHAILRDVTYETLLKHDRKQYHARVAAWLEKISIASGRQAEYQALIAGHYQQAGESTLAALGYEKAGKFALKQGASEEARYLFEQAMQSVSKDDQGLRFQIQLGLSEALGVLGENEQRLKGILELIELGKSLGPAALAEAYYRYGYYQYSQGDCRGALQTFDLALEAAALAGDRRIEVLCSAVRLICLSLIGDKNTAQDAAKFTLERINDVEKITAAQALVNLAVYYLQSGDIAEAARLFAQQATLTDILGNRRYEASALMNLGYSYLMLGLFEDGKNSLDQALQVHRSIGERNMEAYDLLNRSLVFWRMEQFELAQQDLAFAESLFHQTGDSYGLAVWQVYSGLVEESTGEIPQAKGNFSQALHTYNQLNMRGPAVDAIAGLARCALIECDLVSACQQAVEIETVLQDTGTIGVEFPIWAYLTCAKIWQLNGDVQRMQQVITDGHRELVTRAEKISRADWRLFYLENIPEHRELIVLWENTQPSVGGQSLT